MPSVAELLERESTTVDLERGQFERLLRRRDRKRRNQRIGAAALAIILSIVTFVELTRAFSIAERPADESLLRRDGEVITYTGYDARHFGDLVAHDPDTGEERTLVVPDARDLIGSAAWSADGRWAAYEAVGCPSGSPRMTPGSSHAAEAAGLWVTNGQDEPRQLTRPCFEDPQVAPFNELWAWSPIGAQLVVARRSIDGDALLLIDPATGDRTDLGKTAGVVTTLSWSPDGTRITYGARGGGGSVYSVGVGDGEQTLLASSLGIVSNQGVVFGWGIRWSPDGTHIVVQTYGNQEPQNRLWLMNADGSDLHQLAQDLEVQGADGGDRASSFAARRP